MFTEVAFDDENVDSSKDDENKLNDDFGQLEGGSAFSGVVHLHRPGDKGFSCVAETTKDTSALYDSQLVNGDLWLTNECHCLRCETARTSMQLVTLQQKNGTQDLVVVLLDLDNFGFNQFKSMAPVLDVSDNFDVIKHIYVWSFFGSCFARYYGILPDLESVCYDVFRKGVEKKANIKRRRGRKLSVWCRLVAEGRCHFTPCGGQKQGADGVMLQVAHALTHMPVILISGDRELLQVVRANRRVLGKKASRDVVDVSTISELNVINVLEHSRRFVPVWQALEERVRQMLRK